MYIGGGAILILMLLGIIWILAAIVGVVALVDIARRPEALFAQAGQDRTVWLIVAVLSLFVPCVFLGSGYYLLGVRPKLTPRRLG